MNGDRVVLKGDRRRLETGERPGFGSRVRECRVREMKLTCPFHRWLTGFPICNQFFTKEADRKPVGINGKPVRFASSHTQFHWRAQGKFQKGKNGPAHWPAPGQKTVTRPANRGPSCLRRAAVKPAGLGTCPSSDGGARIDKIRKARLSASSPKTWQASSMVLATRCIQNYHDN